VRYGVSYVVQLFSTHIWLSRYEDETPHGKCTNKTVKLQRITGRDVVSLPLISIHDKLEANMSNFARHACIKNHEVYL